MDYLCISLQIPSFIFLKSGCSWAVFRGLCSALHSLDQGLVCSSYCNMETMRKASFHCYYILQPSENGPMLLRRLAGSEEALPVPDINRFINSSVPKEIEIPIQTFLLKIESRDYNPVVHERGFHPKLNSLLKESLQFGSVPTKLSDKKSEVNSTQPDSAEVPPKSNSAIDIVVLEEENAMFDLTAREDKTAASIPEEWEQLVAGEIPKRFSPTCVAKPKLDHSVPSPPDNNRKLDEKTSRILERLEVPTQSKSKVVSPVSTSSSISDACMSKKKPLIPFQLSQASDQVTTSSQLMKPNFQRLKRKYK